MKDIVKKSEKYAIYFIGIVFTVMMLWSCDHYKYVGTYNEGLASAQSENGKWGYINMNKKEVIPCIYFEAGQFSDGYALVAKEQGKYGFINKKGTEVIPCVYFEAGQFSDGYAVVAKEQGKYGLIDKKGTEVIPCQYDFINDKNFLNLFRKIELKGKCGLFDLKNKDFFLPCKYDEISIGSREKKNLIDLKLDNKYGLIDISGNEILPCIYDMLSHRSEGMIKAQLKGKFGLIYDTGKVFIPCKYDELETGVIINYMVSARINNKYGYIDFRTGKEIIPVKYDNIKKYGDYWLATLHKEKTVFDSQGKKIDIILGTMRFGSNNPMNFVDTETGRQLSYRSIVIDDMEVVKTRLVKEQGTEMVEFTLVASKLLGTRQEGSKTVTTYSGSRTIAYSLGSSLNYELTKGVLKISK